MLLNPLDQIALATFLLVLFVDLAISNGLMKEKGRLLGVIAFLGAFASGAFLQAILHPMVPIDHLPDRLTLFLIGYMATRPILPVIRGVTVVRAFQGTVLSTAVVWIWLTTLGRVARNTPTLLW